MGLIVMLDLRDVDPVVFGMRSEGLDEDSLRGIVEGNDELVRITLDVEDDPFVADDTRGSVLTSNVIGARPVRCFGLLEPSFEGILRVAVSHPGPLERLARD